MSARTESDLHLQALRLPQLSRERLSGLAKELRAARSDVTAAQAMRGLCWLALEIALGRAGATAARAFRFAASDPTTNSVRSALEAFLCLVDVDPCTMRLPPKVGDRERIHTSKRYRRGLHNQALRLPRDVRDRLEAFAVELPRADAGVTGDDAGVMTAGEAARGLCRLALDIVYEASGTEVAEAFRLAASQPTVEGALRGLEMIRSLVVLRPGEELLPSLESADADRTSSTELIDLDRTSSTELIDLDRTSSTELIDLDRPSFTELTDLDWTLAEEPSDVAWKLDEELPDHDRASSTEVRDLDRTSSTELRVPDELPPSSKVA